MIKSFQFGKKRGILNTCDVTYRDGLCLVDLESTGGTGGLRLGSHLLCRDTETLSSPTWFRLAEGQPGQLHQQYL